MKKISRIIFQNAMIIFSFAVFATACKKSSQAPVKKPVATTFTFKVDGGSSITIDSANALLYSTSLGRQMDVYAYKGGSEILEFHFDPKTGSKVAGTILGKGAFLTYLSSSVDSYDSQSGTLNITTCDTIGNKVEGDFNFTGKKYPYTSADSKTITEGHIVITKISK